ncbi:MAG TPA: hypothetical protein VF335_07090, partial [Chitinivibrionales bacterium]
YSGKISPDARQRVRELKLEEDLAARKTLPVTEYEFLENLRESHIENPSFKPDFSLFDGLYNDFYKGKGYLVLSGVENFYRNYDWS